VIPGNWSTQILGCATVHLAAYSAITPYIEFAPAEIYSSPAKANSANGISNCRRCDFSYPTAGIGFDVSDELIEEFKMEYKMIICHRVLMKIHLVTLFTTIK
jgi:hypothetical protein